MVRRLAPVALAGCLFAAGCAESDHSGVSPTGSSAVLDALAGTWTLGSGRPRRCRPGALARLHRHEECRRQSGSSEFDGVCAGVEASGTGTGTVSGSTLNWTAEGTATQGRPELPVQS